MVGCASLLGAAALVPVLALLVARPEVDLLRVDGSAAVLAGVVAEGEGAHLGGRSDGLVCKLGEGDEARRRKQSSWRL